MRTKRDDLVTKTSTLQVFVHDQKITVGMLQVQVVECTRLPMVEHACEVFCTVNIGKGVWTAPLVRRCWRDVGVMGGGVAVIGGGVAMIGEGVAMIGGFSGGVAMIGGGVAMIGGGVAMIYGGVVVIMWL